MTPRQASLAMALLAVAAARCGSAASSAGPEDDTAALQDAVERAVDGVVRLDGAAVRVVRAVVIDRPGLTLVCTGTPTPATLRLPPLRPGDGAPVLDVRADGFTLRGCILDGNRTAQPPDGLSDAFAGRAFRAGIRMDGPYRGLSVVGATFENFHGAAIATRGVTAISVRDSTFRDNAFEAAFADNAFVSGDPQHFLSGFTFQGNTVADTGSRDPNVNANALLVHQMSELRIEGNVLTGYERSGIKLENCRSGTVTGNAISGGTLPNFAAIAMQNGAHDLTVQGNDIHDAGTGVDTSLVAGGQYAPDVIASVTIRANRIRDIRPGSLADGIRVLGFGAATTDVTIAENTVSGVPDRGITLRQYRTFHGHPLFARISILDNVLSAAGPCGDFFSGTEAAPTQVTTARNRCD